MKVRNRIDIVLLLMPQYEYIQSISDAFFRAFNDRVWASELDSTVPDLTVDECYQIQRDVARLRTNNGEQIVGYKVGCTSSAIRAQFGLDDPICAHVFKPRIYSGGIVLDWRNYKGCAVEPEMVFRIGCDLEGGDISDEELVRSIEYVSPGIEIHNYHFWVQPPSIQELICSGAIHAGLVIGGSRVEPDRLDFGSEVFRVFKRDEEVAAAPAAEVMGSPLESLRWLVSFLTARGEVLRAGSFVIPGSPTELVRIDEDIEVRVEIENVGEVTASFQTGSPRDF